MLEEHSKKCVVLTGPKGRKLPYVTILSSRLDGDEKDIALLQNTPKSG